MLRLLAKIGRFYSVVLVSIIAAIASFAVTTGAAMLLNGFGFDIRLELAVAFSIGVPLVVAPPISWITLGLLLHVYALEQEMRSLASYDSLTGLLSRHAFFENAAGYVSLANRERTEFSVAIVDLDHFKSINDQYGHPAGDAVLRLFADVVNSVARRSDIIGRVGGEEFAILLPSTRLDEAREFCERLQQAIDQAVLKYKDSIIRYSVSIGLASPGPGRECDIDELLTRADLALYQAKREGRNRTVVFDPSAGRAAVS